MAVMREAGTLPQDHFTQIPNAWLRDPSLSAKAKGLLAYVCSHRAGYRLTRQQIISEMSDGRESVMSGLRELENHGYLVRRRVRNSQTGQMEGVDLWITDPATNGKPVSGADQGKEGNGPGQATNGKPVSGPTREDDLFGLMGTTNGKSAT